MDVGQEEDFLTLTDVLGVDCVLKVVRVDRNPSLHGFDIAEYLLHSFVLRRIGGINLHLQLGKLQAKLGFVQADHLKLLDEALPRGHVPRVGVGRQPQEQGDAQARAEQDILEHLGPAGEHVTGVTGGRQATPAELLLNTEIERERLIGPDRDV